MAIQPDIGGIEGIVTDDPLRDPPTGTTLRISSDLFAIKPDPGLNSIANWDIFNGAVVALHFGDQNEQHILGSGVFVAPGVVMAARHVVEKEFNRLLTGELEIVCTGIAVHGLMIWRCHQVTFVGNTDIALLMVSGASKLPSTLHQMTLTTRMPRVGERLAIAGMRHHASEPVKKDAVLELAMMVSQGNVVSRYERQRDRVMLPFPCVEVECKASGGMSGGPAFDERGFLVGLVTSSFEGEFEGPTFVSLLWPALVEKISPCWPSGFYKEPISLLEMDRRICAIQRPEAIKVSSAEDGGHLATYDLWDQS